MTWKPAPSALKTVGRAKGLFAWSTKVIGDELAARIVFWTPFMVNFPLAKTAGLKSSKGTNPPP
jgi:hypothetical protein